LAEVSPAGEAIELWRRALTQDPYDEGAHHSLVATLRSEGRLREARTAYQTYVAAMDDLEVTSTSWDDIAR
jgi:Flp pilus assembly protein TadD